MPDSWRAPFNEAAALGYRVAVCDTAGRMLACANLEGHVIADIPRIQGMGWHEFLLPDEVPLVLAWFADRDGNRPITYQQLCRIDGVPRMADITLVKSWAGSAWLCYGAVRAHPLPARRRQRATGD